MRRLALLFVAALTTAALAAGSTAVPAYAGLLTQEPCRDVSASYTVFKQGAIPLLDWRENLDFDGRGTMWVSHNTGGRVEGYRADGSLRTSFALPSPGGIRLGPDGMMYAVSGVLPLTEGKIVRFDPTDPTPVPETVASGISGPNGLAIDEDGNFYVGREFAGNLLKLRPDGTEDAAWTQAAKVFGTNGVTIAGDYVYTSVIVNLASPVVRVPLADPGAHSVVADLSPLPYLLKLNDDLEMVNGSLLVTAFGNGELIKVDPATGKACQLLSGLRNPTSVRVPSGFADADPAKHVFVTEASGRILKVTISPR